MIFGMTTFTIVHVVLSLIGIFSGFVVVFGLLTAKRLDGWTALFLMSTVATSVTGFLFPFDRFLPSHAVGILSLIVLAVALRASPGWRLAVCLRGHRCNSPLSQCLRLDCAAFSESAGPESDRSDAIRVTIRARADRRSVAFVAVAIAAAIRFRNLPLRTCETAVKKCGPRQNIVNWLPPRRMNLSVENATTDSFR